MSVPKDLTNLHLCTSSTSYYKLVYQPPLLHII